MYILLTDKKTVAEIIPDENPIFPGVPIEDRYAPDFIAQLIHVDDGTEVEQNWDYIESANAFAAPITYTVEGFDAVEPGQTAQGTITFSVAGTWDISDAGGLTCTKDGDTLTVTNVTGGVTPITLHFTETQYGRETDATVMIVGESTVIVADGPEIGTGAESTE